MRFLVGVYLIGVLFLTLTFYYNVLKDKSLPDKERSLTTILFWPIVLVNAGIHAKTKPSADFLWILLFVILLIPIVLILIYHSIWWVINV